MSTGKTEQFDKSKYAHSNQNGIRKLVKRWKHKRERRRIKENPENPPQYKKYDGWEL